jgi:hypothetical protein
LAQYESNVDYENGAQGFCLPGGTCVVINIANRFKKSCSYTNPYETCSQTLFLRRVVRLRVAYTLANQPVHSPVPSVALTEK